MDFSVKYLDIVLENPFILASAPPTANAQMIGRAFEMGWAGAVIKTLVHEPVKNFANRFASSRTKGEVVGFENIELASERPIEEWWEDIRLLKKKYPSKIMIGSIMGDAKNSQQWLELALGCQEAGADMVELNFSCPHGYAERGKGAAIGQNAAYSKKIVQWLKKEKKLTIPLIPKLTAAVTDISYIGEAVAAAGAHGICAINSFPSLMGFDLKTLKPKAGVAGYTAVGGYSGKGLKPIALRAVCNLAKNPGLPIMACGGIASGYDTAEFLLMGAPVVQICTAVMLDGYGIIDKMKKELAEFMNWHKFSKISDFVGLGNKTICQFSDLKLDYMVKAQVDSAKCTGCKKCYIACQDGGYQAIRMAKKLAVVDVKQCTGCSLCFHVCPSDAISMVE